MKKLFLLLAILPFCVQAQDKGDFELGIGAGINFGNFYGDSAFLFSTRVSTQIGVLGEFYFSDRWGLKTGFVYDSKGADGSGNETKLDYLFIPIYANWHFGRNRNWYLNFGPHIDFLLSAEDEIVGDLKNDTSSFDVGLGVGIGHKFKISDTTGIFIEYQGAGGFINVVDNDTGFELLNTRAALNVGVVFQP
ncbi:porin family protein [Flagellimonas meishanensis]|uniref:porin family protein n=1 Tax=Flagellimonas meishanensis TaxID=2873264 RepID=UPI001CA76846|nr:porin family protein [[Muricauda] meishanensis]